MKMKRILGLVLALMLLVTVPAFAVTPQTSTDIAIASPVFNDSGLAWGNPSSGGWGVGSGGFIEVTSYAQGTKSAWTLSFATGTAFGKGFAFGIQTPNFGFGASGALSGIYLVGAGSGLGIDKFGGTLDFASVGILYGGEVNQGNWIGVGNGLGTYAGGFNQTGATFGGSSYVEDLKFGGLGGAIFDIITPALAVGADGAGALAGGFTLAGYIDTPNFASSWAKTVGFSGYLADFGTVYGQGYAVHQAVVNNNGNFGLSYGMATFNYAGNGSLGYGSAQTGGWTAISNGPGSSSVTSFSSSHSSAHVN